MAKRISLLNFMNPIKTKADARAFVERTAKSEVSWNTWSDCHWFRNLVEADEEFTSEETGETVVFSGDHCMTDEERKAGYEGLVEYVWKYRKSLNEAMKHDCQWDYIEAME